MRKATMEEEKELQSLFTTLNIKEIFDTGKHIGLIDRFEKQLDEEEVKKVSIWSYYFKMESKPELFHEFSSIESNYLKFFRYIYIENQSTFPFIFIEDLTNINAHLEVIREASFTGKERFAHILGDFIKLDSNVVAIEDNETFEVFIKMSVRELLPDIHFLFRRIPCALVGHFEMTYLLYYLNHKHGDFFDNIARKTNFFNRRIE